MKEERILLTHGSGGRLARQLIKEVILPIFDNPALEQMHDASMLEETSSRMAMTTDSYVVKPLFFPGGDIGKLAVCGTVNDLAAVGARPVALSVGLIIEEGFPLKSLEKVLASMKASADQVSVHLITGDTKVVEKGWCDGIYVSTTGVGAVQAHIRLSPDRIEPRDAVIINGPIGNHEAAILCARNDLFLGTVPQSDCAQLYSLMESVLDAVPEAKCARDPTRGGVATVLTELVEGSGYGIVLDEEAIRVDDSVQSVCDILGMDPLFMANEGKMIVIVPEDKAERCLDAMRGIPEGRESRIIGRVHDRKARLTLRTPYGTTRIITLPSGNQLPRIC